MSSERWQFWIDVGGTFTDCVAQRPDGEFVTGKVLSSGVTKGSVGDGSSTAAIVDPARRGDPARFWEGYELRLIDDAGRVESSGVVETFEAASGTLRLKTPLDTAPTAGQAYELASDEEAPVLAIRQLLGLRRDEAVPGANVRLGTTRGTNALITRRGARTALVTTRGFADILHIGYQNRPRLFELAIQKPPPLFAAVAEIDERVTADGSVLRAPDEAQVREALEALRNAGIESLAVCLLHAYRFADHEGFVAEIAREMGFDEISTSSSVAPLVKIVSRGDTTVLDAYLNPVLRGYVARLRESLPRADLRILTSAGGLVAADEFVGKDSILSGPAGGVVGFSAVAQAADFERAIGFDMGGTSTDVSRFDGRFELEFETQKAGVRVVAPMMAIETVAAGGGSICRFDGVKLTVGPESAGADPGPACYGRGGPLAVTDLNVVLGKVLPERFPFPLDRHAVTARLAEIADEIEAATGRKYGPIELADGLLRVANANMVKAIRSISIAKGCDPRDYVMVAFGGAAAQHACAVARELGIRQVLNHKSAGVLSALGIGMADVTRHLATGVYEPYSESAVAALEERFASLEADGRRQVAAEGIAEERIRVTRSLDLRYRGLDAYLTVPESESDTYEQAYAAAHESLYGYAHPGRELEIVAARVEVTGTASEPLRESTSVAANDVAVEQTVEAWFDGAAHTTAVLERERLKPGDRVIGPAIISEAVSTTVIDPDWSAEVLSGRELLLMDEGGRTQIVSQNQKTPSPSPSPEDGGGGFGAGKNVDVSDQADPVMLEIFNNQFAGIAEQMGITLQNTSSSVNVKERLDFSCALFTPEGDLVVNAPHIPVHLGAMSETVRATIRDNPAMRAGDVYVTNDPYRGGSHLPDVTVVTPLFDDETGRLLFFTASRAHHAEIGGVVPGSMPPFSHNLAEEGVLIRNFKLVDGGESRYDQLRSLLLDAPYPTRSVEDNLADIAAQVAANHQGCRDLIGLVERYTLPVVEAYMRHIQRAAEAKIRRALAALPDGARTFVDHLDDGSPISATVTIRGDEATIDFTGTGPVLTTNLNANRAIVTAAVLYCLRLLIDEDIPLNQGVLAPVEIVLPTCLLNPAEGDTPETSPAVVGGNVETSQRVVDVVLGALGVAAASQGTMNNVLFGDATFGYYETICGGAGATADHDGADAVHTHMTNTRLTDPEVLEQRYPVRVAEFSIRRGSGGRGKMRGGDGVVRRIEFLRRLDVSILSQRRGPYAPYGCAGGGDGALGRNRLLHRGDDSDVREEVLGGQVHFVAEPGDTLIVETPGGGAFGTE